MSEFWQTVAILAVVAGAVIYLVHRVVNWRRHKKACASCQLLQTAVRKPEDTPAKPSAD